MSLRQSVVAVGLFAVLCPRLSFAAPDAGALLPVVFGGDRPVTLSVPSAYDAHVPAPLILVLHGYGSSGKQHEDYFGLTRLVEAHGVLLVAPDGTRDAEGNRFWESGTAACCNFTHRQVDDLGYLRGLIEEIRAAYNVDPHRIYVVGHSNGAFLAHRLACELSAEVAAVVSLAGTTSSKRSERCRAKVPVSVLQIHGDRDRAVQYGGGVNILGKDGGVYPGALATTATWARDDGCKERRSVSAPVDLDAELPGAETTVSSYRGCPPGVDVTLWTVRGGGHVPTIAAHFPDLVWPWLEAHRRR